MLKRFILWDYPRASWQYDVMVGLILAFIFLTPRDWFRDQPRIPNASNVAMLPSDHGSSVLWLDSELLAQVPKSSGSRHHGTAAAQDRQPEVAGLAVEPVRDSEDIAGLPGLAGE
jgi:hypothetical protein